MQNQAKNDNNVRARSADLRQIQVRSELRPAPPRADTSRVSLETISAWRLA
jgi:hypothetical protein